MTARVRTIVWFACLACLADLASAQTLTGQIGGTVVDAQKAVLPGATFVDPASADAVRTHLDNVVRKFGASNRVQAVAIAAQLGLLGALGD